MGRFSNLYVDLRASQPGMAIGAVLARLLPVALYLGNDTMLVRTVFGQKLYLDVRDQSVAPALMLDGFWEKHVTRAFLKLLKPGATVVEIGANVGYFTTLAGPRIGPGGRLIAFEANPGVAALLERSVAMNGLRGWCTVVREAVCDRVGTVKFYCMTREQGSSNLRGMDAATLRSLGDDVVELEVPATTLDAFFADKPNRIDVLRMDAEGAEPLVFAGMQAMLAANPQMIIVMEFAREMIRHVTGDARGFLAQLEARGFRIQLIEGSGSLRALSADELMQHAHCDVVLRRD